MSTDKHTQSMIAALDSAYNGSQSAVAFLSGMLMASLEKNGDTVGVRAIQKWSAETFPPND